MWWKVIPLTYFQFLLANHVFAIVRRNGKYPAVCVCVCGFQISFCPHPNICNPGAAGCMSPIPLFSQLAMCNRHVCKQAFLSAGWVPWCRKQDRKTSRGHKAQTRVTWGEHPWPALRRELWSKHRWGWLCDRKLLNQWISYILGQHKWGLKATFFGLVQTDCQLEWRWQKRFNMECLFTKLFSIEKHKISY